LIGARRWLKQFTQDVIRAGAGDRVIDIGCGPGALLHCLPVETAYIGFDRNPAYIEHARRTHGDRGQFICDDLANFAKYDLPAVDIAVAIGILHHVDDDLACGVLTLASKLLKPRGRLITVDPCFHPAQSFLQHLFMSHDRGMHVRPFEQYIALYSRSFPHPQARVKQGYFPFPYTICMMEATRESP
jgi:SAM-dependent methyltransferase